MRKYPYMNPEGPYDSDKIAKLCFQIPSLLRDTYDYQDRLIALMGGVFTAESAKESYFKEALFVRSMCDRLEASFAAESGIKRRVRGYFCDLCTIANIKQQMGPFYLHNAGASLIPGLSITKGIKDPKAFVLAAPDAVRLAVESFNIMTMDRYISKIECERLEALGSAAGEQRVWWRQGISVSLAYALSRLRTGGLAIKAGSDIDSAVQKLSASTGSGFFIRAATPNFGIIRAFRKSDIRSVYSVYSTGDILSADKISPVTSGKLPSEMEIREALSEHLS